jgi:hypothetical protein
MTPFPSKARPGYDGWGLLFIAAAMMAATAAEASGLPLRNPPPSEIDRRIEVLSEDLRLKLDRLSVPVPAAWGSAVADVALLAAALADAGHAPVSALGTEGRYWALIEGWGYVGGADPGAVLGQLLYQLLQQSGQPSLPDLPLTAVLPLVPASTPVP